MHEVMCPKCPPDNNIRLVKNKQKYMVGEPPYICPCRKCATLGQTRTDEQKARMAEATKAAQTPELRARKSKFMKAHPELHVVPNPAAGNEARRGSHQTEESKQRISEGVKKAKAKNKQ